MVNTAVTHVTILPNLKVVSNHPELSKIGSKPLTQFGFGHEKVEHSRDAWIQAHLINPRRWDNGLDKPFRDLTRMPNFYMTEREAYTSTIAILGRTSQSILAEGVRQLSAEEKIANEGMKMINYYNCQGCQQKLMVGEAILLRFMRMI